MITSWEDAEVMKGFKGKGKSRVKRGKGSGQTAQSAWPPFTSWKGQSKAQASGGKAQAQTTSGSKAKGKGKKGNQKGGKGGKARGAFRDRNGAHFCFGYNDGNCADPCPRGFIHKCNHVGKNGSPCGMNHARCDVHK